MEPKGAPRSGNVRGHPHRPFMHCGRRHRSYPGPTPQEPPGTNPNCLQRRLRRSIPSVKDGGGLDPATPETDTLLTLNIFLSYRRDDASAYALLLFQSLSDRYGHSVFMDIETLAPGLDFVDAINDTLGRCDILLALVGRGWLTASDAEGNARLENPEDFVRLEIEAALARNIRVVPVLVGGALMPRGNQLPGDLRGNWLGVTRSSCPTPAGVPMSPLSSKRSNMSRRQRQRSHWNLRVR